MPKNRTEPGRGCRPSEIISWSEACHLPSLSAFPFLYRKQIISLFCCFQHVLLRCDQNKQELLSINRRSFVTNKRFLLIKGEVFVINKRLFTLNRRFLIANKCLVAINRRLFIANKGLFALNRRFSVIKRRLLTISKELLVIRNLLPLSKSGLMQVGLG